MRYKIFSDYDIFVATVRNNVFLAGIGRITHENVCYVDTAWQWLIR